MIYVCQLIHYVSSIYTGFKLRAQHDLVVGSRRAGEGAGLVVLGVAVRIGAFPLEEHGVLGGRAVVGELAPAAVGVAAELAARAGAPSGDLQLRQALVRDVHGAARAAARCAGHGLACGGDSVQIVKLKANSKSKSE